MALPSTPRIVPQLNAPLPVQAAANAPLRHIDLDQIRPGRLQTRRSFDVDRLEELTESIRISGVVQPVVVRSCAEGGYELLAGERRWRAAQAAGLRAMPCVVRDDLGDDEAFVLGLIENLQRESLSPMDTAQGLRRLASRERLTHEAVGHRIGKSREYVSNFLRLLNLAAPVQRAVDSGAVSLGHAKILAGLPADEQAPWLSQILTKGLTVRQLERHLAEVRAPRARLPNASKSSDWLRLEHAVADYLGTGVQIEAQPDGGGELRVRFHSLEALDGLLERIGLRHER